MVFFHVSGKVYGWIFAGLSIGFIGSSQLNSVLLRYYRSERIVAIAITGQVIAAIIFFAGSFNNWFGLPGTIALIFLILCGVGLTNPNASALSLAPFTKSAGTASALMGAMQLGIGSFSSYFISLFNTNSTLPMATVMVISAIIALCVLLVGHKQIGAVVKADMLLGTSGH